MPDVLPGAEAWSSPGGGPHGVLVSHGFTGNPSSMRPLAERFAEAGFAVELPRLPGHGTTVEDMLTTRWDDWIGEAEAAYGRLRARLGPDGRIVLAGLSMGGAIVCRLAADHQEVAGVVAVNPAGEPPAESFLDVLRGAIDGGVTTFESIGSDIAKPGVAESAYDATPIAPLLSLMEATIALAADVGDIRCPMLLCTSPQDHVVPPSASDFLAANTGGPVERVVLERSYHVATLDFDAEEIERRAVEFARKVTAA